MEKQENRNNGMMEFWINGNIDLCGSFPEQFGKQSLFTILKTQQSLSTDRQAIIQTI